VICFLDLHIEVDYRFFCLSNPPFFATDPSWKDFPTPLLLFIGNEVELFWGSYSGLQPGLYRFISYPPRPRWQRIPLAFGQPVLEFLRLGLFKAPLLGTRSALRHISHTFQKFLFQTVNGLTPPLGASSRGLVCSLLSIPSFFCP